MKCPFCGSLESKVLDKRESPDEKATRRRRECLSCKKRFTTYERVEAADLVVIKKDGKREMFDRSKIRTGVLKACEKRPVTLDQIEQVVDLIENDIRKLGSSEVKSTMIGNLVMRRLKRLDKVAYIRFASVYREFADVRSFQKELKKLLKS
ncbi:MAG: transcriptional repressor NrdR [Candidatus Aenigmarchaeota archaeon]|nr:transcriptional repressor NrdR [Candidatus Aenigmarchaeota archaeon]